MLYLVVDPGDNYIPKAHHENFYHNDIPNVMSKSGALRVALNSVSIVTKTRSVNIFHVDKLNVKQVTLLVGMLYDKHHAVKVALTCTDEKKVSKHITNMPSLVRKKLRAPGVKRDASFFEKLKSYIRERKTPEIGLLLPFFRAIGTNEKLKPENQDLLIRLDTMLFETNSEYLAYAWAGQHRRQKINPVFKSVFKPEEKKVKIDPIVKKTRKAKPKQRVKTKPKAKRSIGRF